MRDKENNGNWSLALIKSMFLHLILLIGIFFIGKQAIKQEIQKLEEQNELNVINEPTVEVELYEFESASSATEQTKAQIAGEAVQTQAKTYESERVGADIKEDNNSEDNSSNANKQEEKLANNSESLEKQAVEFARKLEEDKKKEQERLEQIKQQQEAEKKAQAAKAAAEAKQKADELKRQQALAEKEGKKAVGSIDQKLRRLVQNNWMRPPSSHSGMQATMEVYFLKNGTIGNVNVLNSSGDKAFDTSAKRAVVNIGRIPEIDKLDNAIYEAHFKKRTFIFKPD